MTGQQEGEEISDADVDRARNVTWPAGRAILCAAIEKMEEEMEKTVHSDSAYNLVTVMLLYEVFWRHTILAAIERSSDDNVLQWIEREFDDWDDAERLL